MIQDNPVFRFRLFIYLAGAELLLSGVITAFLAVRQGLAVTLVIATLVAFAGLLGIFAPTLLKRRNALEKRALDILKGMIGRSFPFIVILLLTVFFLVVAPDANISIVLSPVLVCVWLIGVEILLLFGSFQAYGNDRDVSFFGRKEKKLGILSVLLAYAFLLLPSRVPTWLDGFPWDSPVEFLFAAVILPFTFIIGWRFFAKRFFVFSFLFLLAVKFILFSFLPQAGLGIYAFTNKESASTSKWDRSYYTFLSPNYTQVINRPYYGLREFPIEWINNYFGFDKNHFWLKLELSGYINLQKDERLIFIVQGAKQSQLELLDISTQKTVPLIVVEQIKDADIKLYKSIPESRLVKIQGTLLFDNYGQMRLEPILLYPDGSIKSLFESPRVWTLAQGANYFSNQVYTVVFILTALGVLFSGLIFAGLFTEIQALWKKGEVSLIDLYLASSALPIFLVALLVHKQYMNILALLIILVFYIVKLTDQSIYQRHFSSKAFLLSVGVVLLTLFLALDINDLHLITIFPPAQDGLEYQSFAHNIFVNQDVFLVNTPPRAYKVLFPYFVGFLHILFGHSAAAQFFFNTWCALLSGALIIKLMKEFHLSAKASLGASFFYLVILFLPSLYIFYFRFGLIEPFSTLLLLLTYYFAIKHQRLGMFLTGIFTVLLRLDYLGIAFTAILLTSEPMTGTLKNAWMQFFDWLKTNWKLLTAYWVALCLPVLLVILGYFLFIPNYMLNAYDTEQTSLLSVLEGLIRIIAGGTIADLREKFAVAPMDVLLITLPLLAGFLIILASVFLRTGVFKKLDLRLGLLALSLLPAYLIVHPTGYLPRFSLSLLPLDLIVIGLFLQIAKVNRRPGF